MNKLITPGRTRGLITARADAGQPRFRGAARVKADASDPKAILAQLNKTFEAFKDEREKELAGIAAKFDDVVQKDQVDRINAEVTELTNAINEVRKAQAALVLGGNGQPENPDVKAHAQQFNNWFRGGDRKLTADMRELEIKAGLTTQSDPDGGYLVPVEMESTIDRVLGTVSAMRGLSRTMSISASSYKKLVNQGGAASGWVGESDGRPETATPTLAEIMINLEELYANPASTQRALDDAATDVGQWLADEVVIEFAEKEGASFIKGDGKKKPKGILAYDTVLNSSYTWGKIGHVKSGAAAAFAATNPTDAFISLFYALKSGYRNNATWLMADQVQETVRKFKDGQGNYIWSAPTTEMPATILGKPVETDDNMDEVGAGKLPVAFGDFKRAYMVVDGVGIRVLRDPFTSKPNVLFYTTKRVGGGVVNFEALKLMKISA